MEKVQVKILNKSPHELPAYGTEQSAGMDLRAWLQEPVTLQPLERRLIGTGVHIALPQGYECQIQWPRTQARPHDSQHSRHHRCRLSWRDWGDSREPEQ